MKNALVIGAKGFVGPYLIKELESAGCSVFSADLPEVDVLDGEILRKAVKAARPDYVVNLAAISSVGASWKNPVATISVNVNGTVNLLEAVAKEAPKAKVLIVGSSEEYAPQSRAIKESDPVLSSNPYGISKIAQENFASLYRKRYGLNIVCTRSFNHTGIGQKDSFVVPSFCKQVAAIIKSGKPGKIFVGNLSAVRDISDVRDIVHVYRMLLELETKYDVYNVGSGLARSMEEILKYIISLSPVKVDVVRDQDRTRPVENLYICANNSRIREFFKGTLLEETIKEMLEYYESLPI